VEKIKIKQLIRQIVKENLPSTLKSSQEFENDPRIQFDIQMDKKDGFAVRYRDEVIGIIQKINADDDVRDAKTIFKFVASDPRFASLNNKTGTAKILKVNMLRIIMFRLEKNS
jgi:ribosomal protein S1